MIQFAHGSQFAGEFDRRRTDKIISACIMQSVHLSASVHHFELSTMAKEEKKAAAADSDEEDEDYVPPTEGESDDEGADGGTSGGKVDDDDSGRPRLPAHKQRAVDEAFETLFGKPPPAAGNAASSGKKGKKKGAKSKKAMKKKKNLLASMFGSSAAGKLLSTSAAVTKADTDSRKRDRPLQGLEKKVVTETKVFAGKEIEVTRTVVGPTGAPTAAATGSAAPAAASAPGGIDAVLANLGGPQKLSTVAKTSSDWDTFKDKTGLDEELEEKAKGKDAYLVKKDFLDRVDQRTFEVEKAERDRERAARGR